jgi:hypothetical protein
MKVHFKNVKWDTDGHNFADCGLKTDFIVNVDIDYYFDTLDDEIGSMLSDWLSDEYGYCHNGFDYEIVPAEIKIDDETIKRFFKNSTEKMLADDDDFKFIIPFALDDEKEISIMLLWESGYDVDPTNKYIDDKGCGINVCLVENNSSFLMEDWKRLTDTCTMSDDYDDIIDWLKEELKRI